jgi:peptide/nickel transport system substrate-binding protein
VSQRARVVDYHAAMSQVAKDLPIIFLFHAVNRDAQSKKVAGIKLYGDGLIRAAFAGFKA